MYEFARGPLVWIAFLVFIFGSMYRLIHLYIQTKKEKNVYPYMSFKYGMRSILHWIIPFGSVNMRKRPTFTILSFIFHFCLIVTPIFLLSHVILWYESWGIQWWTLPEKVSNGMTIVVILIGVIFALRRIANPAVRLVTTCSDYVLLLIVLGPFITGLLAYYDVFKYEVIVTLHIFSGAAWLMVIPFTRIVHMIFFGFTRAFMGSEFGYVRNARDW